MSTIKVGTRGAANKGVRPSTVIIGDQQVGSAKKSVSGSPNVPIRFNLLHELKKVSSSKCKGKLVILQFHEKNLTSTDAALIAEVMEKSKSVTALSLAGNKLGDAGAKTIFSALERNRSVKALDLSYNELTTFGLKDVKENLRSNIYLSNLVIKEVPKSGVGGFPAKGNNPPLQDLMKIIKSNIEFKEARRGKNDRVKLSKRNLIAMPPEIPRMTHLTRLDLSKNAITWIPPEFCKLINLKELILSNNELQFMPYGLADLQQLSVLKINNNGLWRICPSVIALMKQLKTVDVANNRCSNSSSKAASADLINADWVEKFYEHYTAGSAGKKQQINNNDDELSSTPSETPENSNNEDERASSDLGSDLLSPKQLSQVFIESNEFMSFFARRLEVLDVQRRVYFDALMKEREEELKKNTKKEKAQEITIGFEEVPDKPYLIELESLEVNYNNATGNLLQEETYDPAALGITHKSGSSATSISPQTPGRGKEEEEDKDAKKKAKKTRLFSTKKKEKLRKQTAKATLDSRKKGTVYGQGGATNKRPQYLAIAKRVFQKLDPENRDRISLRLFLSSMQDLSKLLQGTGFDINTDPCRTDARHILIDASPEDKQHQQHVMRVKPLVVIPKLCDKPITGIAVYHPSLEQRKAIKQHRKESLLRQRCNSVDVTSPRMKQPPSQQLMQHTHAAATKEKEGEQSGPSSSQSDLTAELQQRLRKQTAASDGGEETEEEGERSKGSDETDEQEQDQDVIDEADVDFVEDGSGEGTATLNTNNPEWGDATTFEDFTEDQSEASEMESEASDDEGSFAGLESSFSNIDPSVLLRVRGKGSLRGRKTGPRASVIGAAGVAEGGDPSSGPKHQPGRPRLAVLQRTISDSSSPRSTPPPPRSNSSLAMKGKFPKKQNRTGDLLVLSLDDDCIRILDLDAVEFLYKIDASVRQLEVVQDNSMLIFAERKNHTLQAWDVVTGKETHRLEGHTGWVTEFAVTSSGANAAVEVYSSSADHSVRHWKLEPTTAEETKKISASREFDAKDAVTSMAIHGEKHIIYASTASGEDNVRAWDMQTGTSLGVLKGHENMVFGIKLYKDMLYTCSRDQTIRAWTTQFQSYECAQVIDAKTSKMNAKKFEITGLYLWFLKETKIKIFNTKTGQHILTMKGSSPITHIQLFGHEGDYPGYLVSCSQNGTIAISSIMTGKTLLLLEGANQPITAFHLDLTKNSFQAALKDGSVCVWSLKPLQLEFVCKELWNV
ncbi:hypothetical protein QOT17_000692 [Balamuthia mandrillaris]